MEITMVDIGERIKNRRHELGLTQTDIYEKSGITSGVLSRIENGRNVPSIIIFYKLSKILECDMDWLATGIYANMQNPAICKNEELLINGFQKLPKEEQNELLEIMNMKLRKIFKTRENPIGSSPLTNTENNSIAG